MTSRVLACASVASLLGLLACSGDAGSFPSGGSAVDPSATGNGAPSSGSGGSQGEGAGPPSTGTPPAGEADAGASGADAGTRRDGGGHDGGSTGVDAGPGPSGGIDYAPYFPTWTWGGSGYAYTSLVDLKKKAGVDGVTLAFVLSGGGCKADGGITANLADVNAFRSAGGHVKASFGGADGSYVESQCKDAVSLATAIGDFVDATGITDLDFDIEQAPVMTDAVNKMRGQALQMVQASKRIRVAFTLAANPSPNGGLTAEGKSVVSNAVAAGVTISHVNLMTMDYGDSFANQPLAPVAIGSLTDANAQLVSLIPGLTTQSAWQVLGVIPMIGKNDDAEVFSLDDAKAVAAFAKQHQLGLVAFWSIDRDQTCKGTTDFNLCSTVDNVDFAFSNILGQVAH